MITRRTRIQLAIFVVITLLGVSFVGARYARLDRVFYDDTYTVVAHFKDSGGIFSGAEVTYRGVTIGRVEEMVLTDEGVDVHLGIDKDWDEIPTDSRALVANRSAVGEQFVELQPQVDDGPYLGEESEIAVDRTEIPIATSKLLEDISNTTADIGRDDLRTVVHELGVAFDGTGKELSRIIDTSNSFIETANDNFKLTTDLIRDSNTVLGTQLDMASSIRTFSKNLADFSDTLAGSDKDLRKIINTGSATVNEVRTFIEDNDVDISSLLNNVRTVSEVVVKHLDGVEQILAIYPYLVEGSFSVVAKDRDTGKYDAHFGLVLTSHKLCGAGYEGGGERSPSKTGNLPMDTDTRCAEPAGTSNPRGSQNAPRAAPGYQAPVIASYDPASGKVVWGDPTTSLSNKTEGEGSWESVLLGPLGLTAPKD
ncbi:MAG: MCE family protein [Nocardioides sp.]|nr:MCE family protein [Nocardioides sp.]